jgi:sugar phosphate isomerase/epimerase
MTMFPSACVWHSRDEIADTLRQIKQTAFHYVDIEAATLDDASALQAQKELGLKVSCMALDRRMPGNGALNYSDTSGSRKSLEYLKQALIKAGKAGARFAYLRPYAARKDEKPFAAAVLQLADVASASGIRLCVEHSPRSPLRSARETLAFVERLSHPNVFLLLDVGHAILTKEKAWEVIAAAGKRLGYIQLNDNDGRRDRHWPLLDGRLTVDQIARILGALQGVGYDGTLGLELARDPASLISGLSKNRNLLLRMQESGEPKSLREPEARRKA